jgi:hypothetical protein
MNEDLLDDLLAGNAALPGAPATTPLPDGPVPPAQPADRDPSAARPR